MNFNRENKVKWEELAPSLQDILNSKATKKEFYAHRDDDTRHLLPGERDKWTNASDLLNRALLFGVILWPGTKESIPKGFAICDGTNGTPNLLGRFPLFASDAHPAGEYGGEEQHTLKVSEMPSHTHRKDIIYSGEDGVSGTPWGSGNDSKAEGTYDFVTEPAGGGKPHNNMPPYYALWPIIYIGQGVPPLPTPNEKPVNPPPPPMNYAFSLNNIGLADNCYSFPGITQVVLGHISVDDDVSVAVELYYHYTAGEDREQDVGIQVLCNNRPLVQDVKSARTHENFFRKTVTAVIPAGNNEIKFTGYCPRWHDILWAEGYVKITR